ncbi:AAA family ATPase [Bifidobacterium pullorum subsp. gallinarum]
MKLSKVKIKNFRSFGQEEEVIQIDELVALIGSNSCGKTTFLNAILKIFGETIKEREVVRSDFHVPPSVNPDALQNSEFYIETIFEFNEVFTQNGIEKYTVPSFFQNFVIEPNNKAPYIRIRLEASWQRSNQPEGIVDTNVYFITSPDNTPIKTQDKRPISQSQLSQIKIIYVPALRDPSVQLRMVTGTLLWRLIQRINFDNSFKVEISQKMQAVKDILSQHSGIAKVKDVIKEQWNNYHADVRYSDVDLNFNTQDIESILKKIDPNFSPTETEKNYNVDSLGDGLRSLFYLSLVGSLLKTEEIALQDIMNNPDKPIDERLFSVIPPCLTIVAVEEPENHVAPHLLGRIIHNLLNISNNSNSQVILSSHSPAIIKRLEPTQIRHFRSCKTNKSTLVRNILLPAKDEDAFKYVKEAVKAYPEIYFSSLVILGEGDSEEIILPKVMDLIDVNINVNEISVVPLGGRHVNHFWKLLYQLDIPFITLLDLDLERGGGGWGRVKYCIDQLIKNGIEKSKLVSSDEQLKQMLTWDHGSTHLQSWIDMLERYNIYFSAPLDIDFLMLERFNNEYISGLSQNEGPEIIVQGETKKIASLVESDLSTQEYNDRLAADIACTLKDESKKGVLYSEEQKKLMIWYRYLFLYRGKPSTHMRVLSETDDDVIKARLPEIFIKMANKIKEELNIKEQSNV